MDNKLPTPSVWEQICDRLFIKDDVAVVKTFDTWFALRLSKEDTQGPFTTAEEAMKARWRD